MVPRPFKVVEIWKELADTFSMRLEPLDGCPAFFAPGQFNMLYVFGVGEVPISVSGDAAQSGEILHTTRIVGNVTKAMSAFKPGMTVGLRGPFGTRWPLDVADGKDLVFVAGGIGLAPLRPAIYQAFADRHRYGNIVILVGARTPEDMLYAKELARWKSRFDLDVQVTVDHATGNWQGRVGFVTKLIASGGFDPKNTVAYTCGPEIMMRTTIKALNDRGVTNDHIYVSMERSMKCAVGFCGHCQWGPEFICRDGPVYRFDQIAKSFNIEEL